MHRRIRALTALCLLGALLPAAAQAHAPTPRYLLALGDSLSQGMQPDLAGVTRNTNEGYANQLAVIVGRQIRGLRLVKLGCGGENTTSMITGHGNDRAARARHCDRSGGSQLSAAVRFLNSHHRRGEVPLLTIDIGANDIDGCASAGANLGRCVVNGEASIKRNVPRILAALRRAAPAGTSFAGMTLYNPVLSGYFSASSNARALAGASGAVLKTINDELTSADRANGFRTADVAGAFHSYDGTHTLTWEGQRIPANVAYVCSWTWACQTPPSGPNIHANKNGYAVIATAFERAIGRLR